MNQIRAYLATLAGALTLGLLDGCVPGPPQTPPGLRVSLPTFSRQVWADTSYTRIIGTDSFQVSIMSGILTINAPQSFADSASGVQWTVNTTFNPCGNENDCIPEGATADDWDGDGDPNNHDSDRDGDGIANDTDNCPAVYNPSQADHDGDGRGDADDQSDGTVESASAAATENDSDGDGISNDADNCPDIPNSSQIDSDCDGVGDPGDPSPEGRIRGGLIGGDIYSVVCLTNGGETLQITVERRY